MAAGHKRKAEAESALHSEWPAQPLPSLDPTLQTYEFRYGPAALLEERRIVTSMFDLAHSIRMPVLEWPGLSSFFSHKGIGLLGMELSCEEGFVDSDEKRNMLVDRLHTYFNTQWKMEVLAITSNPNDGLSAEKRRSARVMHYAKTLDHLYASVDKIDLLRSLFDSLRPETVDLIMRCRSNTEIRRSMLVTWSPSVFIRTQPPAW